MCISIYTLYSISNHSKITSEQHMQKLHSQQQQLCTFAETFTAASSIQQQQKHMSTTHWTSASTYSATKAATSHRKTKPASVTTNNSNSPWTNMLHLQICTSDTKRVWNDFAITLWRIMISCPPMPMRTVGMVLGLSCRGTRKVEGARRKYFCRFVFVNLYNTNFINKLKFNDFYKN